MKKVVVIGSGPGGSSSAALLQNRGFDVTLLEQNDFLGGKCSTREENCFKIDTGIHMFARGPKGPFGKIASELGIPQPWLVRDPSETMAFNRKGFFYLHQQLHSPAQVKDLAIAYVTGRQRIDLINTAFRTLRNFGPKALLHEVMGLLTMNPAYIQSYDDMTVRDFFLQFTEDRSVLASMNCLSMLLICAPYNTASAGEFLNAMLGIFKCGSLGVPRGGAITLPRSLLTAFRRDGGKLVVGVEAKEIQSRDGRVTGVLGSDDNVYEADYVLSNAGLKDTIRMAGRDKFDAEYVKYIDNLKLSYSWTASKIMLDHRVVNLKAPSFFPIPECEADDIFTYIEDPDGVPTDPFIFGPMPTEWDDTLAPPDHQLIMIGCPTNCEVDQEERTNKMLDVAEQKFFSFFPDVERNIIHKSRITNKDTNRITRKGTGECIGLGQFVGQVGVNKPSPKLPIEGLWVVGCDAGARGVGTEQGAASGQLVASLIS